LTTFCFLHPLAIQISHHKVPFPFSTPVFAFFFRLVFQLLLKSHRFKKGCFCESSRNNPLKPSHFSFVPLPDFSTSPGLPFPFFHCFTPPPPPPIPDLKGQYLPLPAQYFFNKTSPFAPGKRISKRFWKSHYGRNFFQMLILPSTPPMMYAPHVPQNIQSFISLPPPLFFLLSPLGLKFVPPPFSPPLQSASFRIFYRQRVALSVTSFKTSFGFYNHYSCTPPPNQLFHDNL